MATKPQGAAQVLPSTLSQPQKAAPLLRRERKSDPGRTAWLLMTQLFLAMRSRFIEAAATCDLSAAQAAALRSLEPGAPVPMSVLAEALVCDASNVTGIVDKLESRGLIERQGAEHDRRVKMLVVTEKGVALRRSLLERLSEPPDQMVALSTEDQERLGTILQRLV